MFLHGGEEIWNAILEDPIKLILVTPLGIFIGVRFFLITLMKNVY